jgi:3D (Asp-Asp-Asp) domain-containing protein
MSEDRFDISAPASPGQPLTLWATTYRIYSAREAPSGIPLLDLSGNAISRPISEIDFCRGAVQGGILVMAQSGEPKLFNFSAVAGEPQADCSAHVKRKAPWVEKLGRSRFAPAKALLGVGASGDALVPFRSLAVDKALIPLGTVLFIPDARGAKFRGLAGKELVHDGYFYAADTGGAIRGKQIDVFLGRTRGNPFPQFIRNSPKKPHFEAHVIDDPVVLERLKALHAAD